FFVVLVLFRAIPVMVGALITLATTEFAVTNQRIIAKTGLIRRKTTEILLEKVESIKIDQDFLGRLIGFGTIEVIGTGGTAGKFKGISNPVVFRKNISKV